MLSLGKYRVCTLNVIIAVATILSSLIYGCKKHIENQPPNLEILSPTDGKTFQENEVINIVIKASDDKMITTIRAGINDENATAVVQAQSITVNQATLEKTISFNLNQSSVKDGKHFCYVTVSDGEKEKTIYRQIYMLETAKVMTGYITFEQNGNNTNIHHYNATSQKQGVYNSNGLINSANFFSTPQVLLTHVLNADATAYQLPQFSVPWNLNSQVKSIAKNDRQFFLIKSDDYISGYNLPDYSPFRSYYESSFTFHPEVAVAGTDLFCSFNKVLNQFEQNKLIVYDLNTSVILNEYMILDEVTAMIPLQQNRFALILKSTNNQYKIGIYDAQTNLLNIAYTTANQIKSISRINANSLLILSNIGIGNLYLQNNAYQLIVNKNNIKAFELEAVSNTIYVLSEDQLQRYDIAGVLLSSTSLDHQPYYFCLTYNRE